MTTKKTPTRKATMAARAEITLQSNSLAQDARGVGTLGQASEIAAMSSLEAAHAAVECFRLRLAMRDGRTALDFIDALAEYAAVERARNGR